MLQYNKIVLYGGEAVNTKRYAVFLDLDRTLMCANVVPQVNIDTIQQARKQGHFVFVNTARSYAYVPEHIRNCDFLDGFVAGIGTDLRFRGWQIFSHNVVAEDVVKVVRLFENDDREVCLEGEDVVIWMNPRRQSAKNGLRIDSAEDFLRNYKDCKISKFYVGGLLSNEEQEQIEKNFLVFYHADYTEFVSKGYGKGRGLERMMEYLGLPVENSIAMGDSANDKEMLLSAGISVAMGDAIPEIRAVCEFVSCNAKDGGVAKALKELLPTCYVTKS